MKIGLDLDRVLFDTDTFDDFYKKETGLYHVEDPAPVKNNCYDPELHAKLCGISQEKVWKIFENDLSRFLYSDLDLLEKLDNHELIIVTRGNERFQRAKIKSSGADERVDDIIIVQEDSKNKNGIDLLVDDRKEELENVDVPGVHIDRPSEGLNKLIKEVTERET